MLKKEAKSRLTKVTSTGIRRQLNPGWFPKRSCKDCYFIPRQAIIEHGRMLGRDGLATYAVLLAIRDKRSQTCVVAPNLLSKLLCLTRHRLRTAVRALKRAGLIDAVDDWTEEEMEFAFLDPADGVTLANPIGGWFYVNYGALLWILLRGKCGRATPSVLSVYLALCARAPEGECFGKFDTIASLIDVARATVKRAMKSLREMQLVQCIPQLGRGLNINYHYVLPPCAVSRSLRTQRGSSRWDDAAREALRSVAPGVQVKCHSARSDPAK